MARNKPGVVITDKPDAKGPLLLEASDTAHWGTAPGGLGSTTPYVVSMSPLGRNNPLLAKALSDEWRAREPGSDAQQSIMGERGPAGKKSTRSAKRSEHEGARVSKPAARAKEISVYRCRARAWDTCKAAFLEFGCH